MSGSAVMELKALVDAAAARFAEHGLVGWVFGLSDSKRQLGVCKYRQKRIEISEYYARHNPDVTLAIRPASRWFPWSRNRLPPGGTRIVPVAGLCIGG